MMKNIITLVSPNTLGSYRSALRNNENLALGFLAATMEKQGHQVEIIDARINEYSPETVARKIQMSKPFFLGFSVISEESIPWIEALKQIVGAPDWLLHVSMGGYYPSLQPWAVLQRLPFVDSVVQGEGELTLVELVNRILLKRSWEDVSGLALRSMDKSIRVNCRRPVIQNLDSLPFPKRYANHHNTTDILIEGGRGCYGRCTFCSVGPHLKAGHKFAWRGRTPENIVSEIQRLRSIYPNNKRYRFIDPDFFGSASEIHSKRTLELAALIQKYVPGIELFVEARVIDIRRRDVLEALKAAGLKEIYLGIESGSNRILKQMGKDSLVPDIVRATQLLDDLGINYRYGYLMITPWTEYQDIVDCLALLQIIGRVQFDKLFNKLCIIPGTILMDQVGKELQLTKEKDTGYYLYEVNPLVKNIRAFGQAFDTRHKIFAERLWCLYNDVQRHEQCHVEGATAIQRRLSNLFLTFFEFCLERSKSELLTETDIDKIIISATAHFQGELRVIRDGLDPSVR